MIGMNLLKIRPVGLKTPLISVWLLLLIVLTPPTGKIALNPQSSLAVDTDPNSLINAVNALRQANGLPAYSINPTLMAIAQQHAQYMSAAGVTHNGAGGSTPWQRALAAGYPLAGDLSLGGFFSENITAGSNMSVEQAVTAWQGDAPHINTMLSSDLSEIGAGAVMVGDYVYYVIDCARPTNNRQPQSFTPPAAGTVVPAAPLAVNTIIAATPLENGKIIHLVKPGETLWLIAVSYGVKVADIRGKNNLAITEAIYPGEKLFIKQQDISTPEPPTLTQTLSPTIMWTPSSTLAPSPTSPPTQIPTLPVSSTTSYLILGIIIGAALVMAAVLVWAGIKK